MTEPRRQRSLTAGLPLVVTLAPLLLGACSGGRNTTNPPNEPPSRLAVTTSTRVVPPTNGAPPAIDLADLGVNRIEARYRLTTPADQPFAFDLVSWRDGAAGEATLSMAHVRDGSIVPIDNGLSLATAGLLPLGNRLASNGKWTSASGDGLVRLTLQGRIKADQVLAITSEGSSVTIVEIAIGPSSDINRLPSDVPEPPSVVARDTVYSSDSWQFGVPTIAGSGDRTSIVCYEGDRALVNSPIRYELRLQHDRIAGAVTGGASFASSADSGYWRDHEIVALHNVLAVVRSESNGARVRLSFDRGATFGQDVAVLPGVSQTRLVQAAMAADYSLAVASWRARQDGGGFEFVLVEGRPVAFDAFGSPTWFQFTPPEVVHTTPHEVTPMTTGIAWSAGGDLVLGYAANWFESRDAAWLSVAEFRCAVRPFGGTITDQLVDREEIVGMDPSVAVLGQGSGMRIFYAYEGRAGLRLAASDDAGATFELGTSFGAPGDHLPTVFARELPGRVQVDVLYLAGRERGLELHRSRWTDWGTTPREDEALTKAVLQQPPYGGPIYGGYPIPFSLRQTQVNWLGYDAVLDGDQIIIAYDEATFDNVFVCLTMLSSVPSGSVSGPAIFQPAVPPPLAPGLTEVMPLPNPVHAHQLKLLRIL